MLKLWNSLTRTREAFGSIDPKEVRMYSCGPTVYQRAHIGNLRAYVIWDILKRTLQAGGYKVTHCMNITDVGHLVGDGDEGEDKLQSSATKEGRTAWDVAKQYEEAFKQDMASLNVVLPEPPLLCRATEHIPEQIKLIQILDEKGYAYSTSDGVYFDTSLFPDYGRLSGQPLEEKMEGTRVEVKTEKRHPTDFALWKFSYPNGRPFDPSQDDVAKRRHMEWDSPWGLGFPGWHIECSAMSRKYLGQPFDIHTGGVDHIPVHHENEIAQSMAAYALPLANFWVHCDFLTVDNQKMSKSLGNTYTLDDVVAHGIDAMGLRYFYLGAQYRGKLNFTWEAGQAAQNALNKLRELARTWDPATDQTPDAEWHAKFMEEMDDDLNTPNALAVVWELVKSDLDSGRKAAIMLIWNRILGLDLDGYIAKPIAIPEQVKQLAQRRWEAKTRQDWDMADKLRHEIDDLGWRMEDGPEDYKLKLKM